MINLTACPVCDSYQITRYNKVGTSPRIPYKIMPGVTMDTAIITQYWVCQDCHIIFQNPRMSDRDLDKFYSQGVYRKLVELTDKKMDEGEAYRAKVDTEIIRKLIGLPKAHLDIGSSRGYFLDLVGASIKVGVESSVDYVRVQGVTIYPEMDQIPRKLFDLVTALHVLEHVSKPVDFLEQMAQFVSKKGYLVIEVPTWKSPGGPLRLSHLYHFEPDVLKLICKQVGLIVTHVEFTPHLMLICTRVA